ncbi:MAG: adenylyl-sulfate kinase [Candidatus Sedimenticola endophacoides]|uniref:Adenylyl-sulfate kinase n=2 Tax=Candidatus Sedimenticola endophacoides TaxID=2548426 RepID=A0A6N4E9M8_9GAMM|nr:MAG: adenylyl-sulfate kinase [Candidatus Sedimenticola endophacoides]OQX32593.1 MAG: adenylyl-sulfate kinase [Candidatus Sedimenticola endophacoides]OQX42925.1 MAG: adenylyl-sulfate kinase [Candidatus Sedimenticola endophacoides]OQX47924.1 MAG: adenylyl-sulfate kinase [Candidatus Sedimenticola endophacoides]PUE02809.1 MAG: adenylyl-sulfate kinase [Candidatus Sedimenticola endophacoides]
MHDNHPPDPGCAGAASRASPLPHPHGGCLVDLVLPPEEAEALKRDAGRFLSLTLNYRQLCDLELLMNGAFSPLTGYMDEAACESVMERMQLPGGTLWPLPLTLDVDQDFADRLRPGDEIALRDQEGFMVAVFTLAQKWRPDRRREAERLYGTTSTEHAGVRRLVSETGEVYLAGGIRGTRLPDHYTFERLWHTPRQLREELRRRGWLRVLAVHSSQPIHRLHRDLALNAAKAARAHILLHPTVGITKPGDPHHYARVHCYQKVLDHFPQHLTMLSLLPLSMRLAGPREALLHAIVNQNYGCSHIMIGPYFASPPERGFYPDYSAQELVARHQERLEILLIATELHRYSPQRGCYLPLSELEAQGEKGEYLKGALFRQMLQQGKVVPDWYSFPEVLDELKRIYPPRHKQGLTLFFTGLSGSGKSTLARILEAKLVEEGSRPVTLLDGDVVRLNLSSELGFSREHRDLNIRRIGFVANEITKNGGIAICAPIAPYAETRRAVRQLIEPHGAFIEIHVSTPLEVCEARDRKGLYAKARKGIIPAFTGISDPYEEPQRPEFRIDTAGHGPMEAAQEILLYLLAEGYLNGH